MIRSESDASVSTYQVELGGPLTDEQREKLLHVAETCPVRQTLSRPIRFEAR
jgi:uncharacterized OsmC-like protein